MSAIDDVGERERLMHGGTAIRTHCCLRCPFLAVGLPFIAEGLPVRIGDQSHWNGFSLLLLVEDTPVNLGDSGGLGSDCDSFRQRATGIFRVPPGVTEVFEFLLTGEFDLVFMTWEHCCRISNAEFR